MLTRLSIRHFAIVDEVEIEFKPNLSVITGETGAGKSIIIDALTLLLGKPASDSLIKVGFENAWVEVTFLIDNFNKHQDLLTYQDLDSPSTFTFFRQISRNKTNFSRINGQMTPLKTIKKLLSSLLYIVSQHQSVSILDPIIQRQLIDDYAQLESSSAYKKFKSSFSKYQLLKQQLEESPSGFAQLQQEREFIRFQLDDLKPHEFSNDEEDRLKELRQRYKVRNKAIKSLNDIQDKFNQVNIHLNDITKALAIFPSKVTDNVEEAIQTIISSIEMPLSWCQKEYSSYTHYEKVNIDDVESRLDLIFRYKTKYHVNHTRELVDKINILENRDLELTNLLENSEELKIKLNDYRKTCLDQAMQIHEIRQNAANQLSQKLEKDCLNLQFSYCQLQFNCLFDSNNLSQTGADQMDWQISTNKGIPLGPLSHVASGGELSRLMLAIESYMANLHSDLTLIFDEIDTGIGGITAHSIGTYLAKIASAQQVICITHLPQIAQLAQHHIQIEKYETDLSTNVKVTSLTPSEKKAEIKRMVGGDLIATALT